MPPRGRALGRSMSVKDMKAERDAKLAQREAEKVEAGVVTSPRVADLLAQPASPTKKPAASGRKRGLGRSMSVKDMKAERDAKLADQAAVKAAASPPSSPVAAAAAAATTAVAPVGAVSRPAASTSAAAVAPVGMRPKHAPSNWDSMSKLEQIKWKKEHRTKAQVSWGLAATNVKVITALASIPAPEPAPGAGQSEELPDDWDTMSKLDQIRWRRERGLPPASPVTSPAASPTAAAAKAAAAAEQTIGPITAGLVALDLPAAATAREEQPESSPTTMAALKQQVEELTRQKECLMLAAIDEIKALEEEVQAYRQAVGTVEQARALSAASASSSGSSSSRPAEGIPDRVVPLKLHGVEGSASTSKKGVTPDLSSSDDDDDDDDSDDDDVDLSSSDDDSD